MKSLFVVRIFLLRNVGQSKRALVFADAPADISDMMDTLVEDEPATSMMDAPASHMMDALAVYEPATNVMDALVVAEPASVRFTWTVENFPRLKAKKYYSDTKSVGEYKW
ncbi:hypothetical protein P3L10_016763 [Capsicum annuum]